MYSSCNDMIKQSLDKSIYIGTFSNITRTTHTFLYIRTMPKRFAGDFYLVIPPQKGKNTQNQSDSQPWARYLWQWFDWSHEGSALPRLSKLICYSVEEKTKQSAAQ